MFIGIGVGFAGTPASHSLTGSVPVRRAGMASGTADLQRDLGGAIMQSIFGALLTAGYAAAASAAIARVGKRTSPPASQNQLTKSFAGAEDVAQQYPQYASQITAGGEAVVPRRRPVGLHRRPRRGRCSAPCSSSSPSRRKSEEQELLARYHAEDAEGPRVEPPEAPLAQPVTP